MGGCKNTGGGRWFMADDQGRVCQRAEFDYTTGCCEHGAQQYQCDSCDSTDSCCSSYEHCISCCMSPSQQPELHMTTSPRGFGKEETGYWETPYDYCQSACRTTSRSTQHENAFISERRFCFAGNGRPHTLTPRAPSLPQSVTAVVGAVGASCDAVCNDKDQECNADHFAALNDCNTLRAMFMCEAGCGPSELPTRREFPGYVVDRAPKNDWPAFCFLYFDSRKAGMVQQYNCSASAEHVQRVCPCAPALGLGTQAGQLDALQSNQQQMIKTDEPGGANGNVGQRVGGEDLNAANINDDSNKDEQQFALGHSEDEGDDQRRRRRNWK